LDCWEEYLKNMSVAEQKVVLVVDDDQDLCEMVGELLSSAGYQPLLAYDGESGLQLATEKKPDAIVLDIKMKGKDGYEVCKTLKMRRDTNLVPIIMLTALSKDEERVKGIQVGANFYLVKPCEPEVLLNRVKEAFEWADRMKADHVCGRVTLTIESSLNYLDEVNDLLSGLFALTELPEEDIHRVKYAVLEMGHNAIEWGNKSQRNLAVTLDYTITPDKLIFSIKDQGDGFDPGHLPHAADGVDPIAHMEIREKLGLREGGFGILLSKEFMDEVGYNEKGNEVTLVKHLGADATSATAQ